MRQGGHFSLPVVSSAENHFHRSSNHQNNRGKKSGTERWRKTVKCHCSLITPSLYWISGGREKESRKVKDNEEKHRERERGAETSFAANEEIPSDGATVPLDPAPITRLVYSSAANRGPRLNGKQTRPPPGQLRL